MPRPLVLVDATPLQSEHRFRGVGTYTLHLCEALARLAPDEVRFAAEARTTRLLPDAVRDLAVTAVRPHRPAQMYWIANEWFLRAVARRAKAQVFHSTDFNGLVRPEGYRVVATLYDLTWHKQRAVGGQNRTGLSIRLSDLRWQVYYGHKLPVADHLLAISEEVRRDAVSLLKLSPERIATIPLGVDVRRFRPARGEGAFSAKPPYLLFLGGDEPHKNLARVLRAFAAVSPDLEGAQLFVAGPWPREAAMALAARATTMGVRDRVHVLGYVPAADLPSLYANATALIFPSLEEGFGLPVLEAMSAGTPVLTSDRGALAETAGGAAFTVDPTDEHAIATGMRLLVRDADLRARLSAKGQAHAADFAWDTVAQRTLQLYRQCAADRGPVLGQR